jgi:threonine dehydrogenase-like Zn-dependent dehydrogenase
VDLGPQKGALAAAAGADAYVDAAAGDPARAVLGQLPAGADVTFVASGHAGALDTARAMTRPGGQIVVVSYFDQPHTVAANAFVSAELTVTFSALSTARDFAEVIGWLSDGSVDPRPLITHRFDVAQAADALALMDRRDALIGKVMLLGTRKGCG